MGLGVAVASDERPARAQAKPTSRPSSSEVKASLARWRPTVVSSSTTLFAPPPITWSANYKKCLIVILSLRPIFMPSGKNEPMSTAQLRSWYGRLGFKGSSQFKRESCKIISIGNFRLATWLPNSHQELGPKVLRRPPST